MSEPTGEPISPEGPLRSLIERWRSTVKKWPVTGLNYDTCANELEAALTGVSAPPGPLRGLLIELFIDADPLDGDNAGYTAVSTKALDAIRDALRTGVSAPPECTCWTSHYQDGSTLDERRGCAVHGDRASSPVTEEPRAETQADWHEEYQRESSITDEIRAALNISRPEDEPKHLADIIRDRFAAKDQEIADLRAQVDRLQREQAWKPIETAPHDEYILAYWMKFGTFTVLRRAVDFWIDEDGSRYATPSHWKLLSPPSPPADDATGGPV